MDHCGKSNASYDISATPFTANLPFLVDIMLSLYIFNVYLHLKMTAFFTFTYIKMLHSAPLINLEMQNDPLCIHVCLSLTWMHPFLKTGTFQRRASLTRAASSRTTSRRLSMATGFFIATTAEARLHPGHTHLTEEETDEATIGAYWPTLNKLALKSSDKLCTHTSYRWMVDSAALCTFHLHFKRFDGDGRSNTGFPFCEVIQHRGF